MSSGSPPSAVRWLALLSLIGVVLVVSDTRASPGPPACSSLPNPLYFAGTATGRPMLQQIGARVATANAPNSNTYVFQQETSCAAVGQVLTTTGAGCTGEGTCITGTAEYYGFADGGTAGAVVTQECTLDPGGTHVDVALSDLFAPTCVPDLDPNTIVDFTGPAHALVFVVPIDAHTCDSKSALCEVAEPDGGAADYCCPLDADAGPDDGGTGSATPPACGNTTSCAPASGARAISANEAYFVLGFSQGGGVTPWSDPTQIFLPGEYSEEQTLLSYYVNVPPSGMLGIDETLNGGDLGVLSALEATPNGAALGLVSDTFYDQHRDELAALAFRVFGQYSAYYPDFNSYPNTTNTPSLTLDTFEKQNVRDGHYPMWTYLHAIAASSSPGTATSRGAQTFGLFLTGRVASGNAGSSYDVTQGAIDSQLIPQCAMHVSRVVEAGDLSPYSDPSPCNCFFESNVTSNATGCVPCSRSSQCNQNQVCSFGFCEAL
jgi:hypothetical protein